MTPVPRLFLKPDTSTLNESMRALGKAFEAGLVSAEEFRKSMEAFGGQNRAAVDREPRWSVKDGVAWSDRPTQLPSVELTVQLVSAGRVLLPHGLNVQPECAFVTMTSSGTITVLDTDETFLHLEADMPGCSAVLTLVYQPAARQVLASSGEMILPAAVVESDRHIFVGGSIDGRPEWCDRCDRLYDDPIHIKSSPPATPEVKAEISSKLSIAKRKFRR
ncbi:MAG: hypothetical protein ACRDQZ_11785 [Mycobacteriales bacterium]